MKKKLLALLLLTLMLVNTMLLTACGGSQKTTAPDIQVSDINFDPNEPVTIKFVHTMGAALQEVLDEYIVEFNKLYPNITVEHENGGGYDDVRDNLKTQINVGAQPNIAYCYPDHVALYNMAGAVQTLDDFISSTTVVVRADGTSETIGLTQEQIDAFVDGFYAEGAAYGDGKMYTMPFSKSTEVLYYNKEFFAEHNLKVPTTWEEMEDVCKKIKEIDPKSIPLGYDSEANLFITMCEQLGSDYTSASGDHYLFDNEENKAFVEMFREWFQKGYMTTKALHGAYTSALFINIPTEENPVRSYMSIGSSGGAQHQRPTANTDGSYPFTVGIAPIPQANPDAPAAISQGPNVTIFKKSNPQEVVASWLFVKYLTTSVDFQAAFSVKSGYMPVLETVSENEIYKEYIANAENGNNYITALSVKVSLEQGNAYFVSPAFNGSSAARDEVGAIITAVLPFEGDANAVKNKIDQEFQDAIDECEYNS